MPRLYNVVRDWWYRHCRQRDLEILWPECKKNAKNVENARTAFLLHASLDPAWKALNHTQAARIINALK